MTPLLRTNLLAAGLILLFASSAYAEIRVAATIGPLHSLVSMVTQDVVEPDLLMQPGASPHFYSMTPSQTAALAEADVVFVVGEGFELWLERPLETLAGDADIVALGSAAGVTRLGVRDTGAWGGQHQDGGDVEAGVDPHFWLAPENAIASLDAIARALASADPERAAIYRANAEQASAELDELRVRINNRINVVRDRSYIVFHDAYQYFEASFDLHPVGAVLMDDTRKPSVARIKQLRDEIEETHASCIFVEPQFSPAIANTVAEGADIEIAELDPIGADLAPGAGLYPQLLENLAASLADCLGRGQPMTDLP